MTYLQLINAVLRRLRVPEVSSVEENAYSMLIGDFVNDAKNTVEVAWDWSALKTTLTVTTAADIFNYSLTGSNNSVKILDVVNDTSNWFLTYKTAHWMNNTFLNLAPSTGAPKYYSFNGLDSEGDNLVDLYPIPDDVYSLRFNCILRNPELVDAADVLLIPSRPVIHLALALAARERGETGGTSTLEYFSMANDYLSDAIALDANNSPESLIFVEV